MNTSNTPENIDIFERYQRLEYQHIADAHFRTMDSISAFFRYYLLLMGLPISAMAVLFGFGPAGNINTALHSIRVPGVVGTGVFALVGFCVMIYVVNLRMDVILYARTANSVRKYCYDNSKLSVDQQLSYRVLPQSRFLPRYYETIYFVPVVVTFGFINSLYLLAFLYLLLDISSWWIPVLTAVAFVTLHCAVYRSIANTREKLYLKSLSIGVDIDGVLNQHREQFSKWLLEKFNIRLDAEAIATIPVHEGHNNVSRDHEVAIFNDPTFWTSMPPIDEAARVLCEIHNTLNVPIYYFTNRPWPDNTSLPKKQRTASVKRWKTVATRVIRESNLPKLGRLMLWIRVELGFVKPLHAITKIWLRANGFFPQRVFFESNSRKVANFGASVSNRFAEATKRQIRIFVEDNLENANRLSPICDVVFLMDHPYNHGDERKTLGNVLRVASWDEVYNKIRSFS